jgi:hypothetical protein
VNWTATPPTATSLFNGVTTSSITLSIPHGSTAAYSGHAVWGAFKIVERP